MSILEKPDLPPQELEHIPGAEPSARIDAWWWLVALIVCITAVLLISWPDPFWNILKFVQDGIVVTVTVTLISFVLVLFLGMLGGLGRLSTNRIVYLASTLYVELVRGVPLLVQLMAWYFAVPVVVQTAGKAWGIAALEGFQADPIVMAILGLVFCYSAYMSEIYRAGIQSIPKGQMEAARSLGMTYFQAMRHVVLPQAVRVILPPIGNEFIALLKDSSLVSVVAVADLTRRGREYSSTHFNPIEVWLLIALLYLIMTLFSARIVNWVEKKTKFER
ncbi:MAG: amino acid ABC transporter permease [Chloroflexi bacterium]|nr:amino acid ABC transporter permease [Chloroflexota bacterium]